MKNKNLHIRLTEIEYESISRKAALSKNTITEYVVKCCLGKQIFVVEGLNEVIRQQKYIGNNLNQLTKIANSGIVSIVGLNEILEEYKQVNEKLGELLERRRWR